MYNPKDFQRDKDDLHAYYTQLKELTDLKSKYGPKHPKFKEFYSKLDKNRMFALSEKCEPIVEYMIEKIREIFLPNYYKKYSNQSFCKYKIYLKINSEPLNSENLIRYGILENKKIECIISQNDNDTVLAEFSYEDLFTDFVNKRFDIEILKNTSKKHFLITKKKYFYTPFVDYLFNNFEKELSKYVISCLYNELKPSYVNNEIEMIEFMEQLKEVEITGLYGSLGFIYGRDIAMIRICMDDNCIFIDTGESEFDMKKFLESFIGIDPSDIGIIENIVNNK